MKQALAFLLLVFTANVYALGFGRIGQTGADGPPAADAVNGTGTIGYVPKFSAASTLVDSTIWESGAFIGISATPDSSMKMFLQNTTTGSRVLVARGLAGQTVSLAEFRNPDYSGIGTNVVFDISPSGRGTVTNNLASDIGFVSTLTGASSIGASFTATGHGLKAITTPGMGALITQTGVLTGNVTTQTAHVLRENTGAFTSTGAVLHVEDSTAYTGNLVTVTKQATTPFKIANTGDTSIITGLLLGANGVRVTVADAAPSSPVADDLWFETDTNILWYWDTAPTPDMWLSVNLYHAQAYANGISATTRLGFYPIDLSATVDAFSIYLVDMAFSGQVAALNDGTRYWEIKLYTDDATPGSPTQRAIISTDTDLAAFAAGTYIKKATAIGYLIDNAGTDRIWQIDAELVGVTPGALSCGVMVTYRMQHD